MWENLWYDLTYRIDARDSNLITNNSDSGEIVSSWVTWERFTRHNNMSLLATAEIQPYACVIHIKGHYTYFENKAKIL